MPREGHGVAQSPQTLRMPSYPSNCLHFAKSLMDTTSRVTHSETGPVLLDIIVVGAGLGGLATAVALRQVGHKVTVYEQSAELKEVGAGIQIPPNSTRLLFQLGLEPYLKPYVTEPESLLIRRWQNGKIIGKAQLRPNFAKTFDAPYYVIHRADFLSALSQRALDLGVEIKLGVKVVDYDPMRGGITVADGIHHSGDLVIAADGIKSVARRVLLGGQEIPLRTPGMAAYRAVVDVDKMKRDPELSRILERPGLNAWIGDSKHAMTYTVGLGRVFNLVMPHPDASDPAKWNAETALQDMRAAYRGWDPVLTKILDMVEEPVKWPLLSGSLLTRWTIGQLVILGDAAHGMLPYMAQGAAMAVEDGVALARSLAHIDSLEQLPDALSIFEKVRIWRTSQMREATVLNGQLWHFPDGPLQEARDTAMTPEVNGLPFSHSPNQWSDPTTQMWCYGYDTEKEINTAWRNLRMRQIRSVL
ncbi:hypothetical protein BDV26DRAFT_253666 [Aspergillus bertholletiae]|uniref:FAD-binding domain-containing protein n=1 Tax=Aspergillus bertholletiae TaxID=1226010 RepID=A0A5N7BL55_9EURO|nr:hypothetical protein BDV26DRAFT_253666 [Aspergillus bertholletiae]